jgi:hypothetical protein
LNYLRFIQTVILVLFISSLVAKDDGFINKDTEGPKKPTKDNSQKSWTDVVNPKLQASYEAHEKEKRDRAQFSKDIGRLATLKKKQFDLVATIHRFNLRGPHYDPDKFDEYTKWMRIYEKEILVAMNNYDSESYVFFFEEFAKLTIKRAGMINPNCKLKDCECRNYKD